MASYFNLILDTTPPAIEIIAPSYTIPNRITEITVLTNEELSNYQEIYIIDSHNVRHDVIFDFQGNKFIGLVDFCDYSFGIATIFARVKDSVFNLSGLVSKTINILQVMQVDLDISESTRGIGCIESVRALETSEEIRAVAVQEIIRQVVVSEQVRPIEVIL